MKLIFKSYFDLKVFECMSMISEGISDIVWCEYENMLSWEGNLGRINSKWETMFTLNELRRVLRVCIFVYIYMFTLNISWWSMVIWNEIYTLGSL